MSNQPKRKAKRKYSLKYQLTITFILLMIGAIIAIVLLNTFFLDSYYVKQKESTLESVYSSVNASIQDGTISSDSAKTKFAEAANRDNVGLLIMNADDLQVLAIASDIPTLLERVHENIFGLNRSIDEDGADDNNAGSGSTEEGSRDRNQNGGQNQYYIKRVLEKSDNYQISLVYDRVRNSNAIELFGTTVDDNMGNYYIMLRTPLESIHNSSTIATKFTVYVGILVAIIGALVALYLGSRMTRPILELTQISERMKHLDFSAKYTGNNRTEVQELGENINELSEALEHTISELKTANNELRKDLKHRTEIEDMRQEFLSNVTHELKTPLALIQGYAEGLQDGIADDPQSSAFYCDVIIDEAGKMNNMVKQLLTLNQLEFGNSQVNMEHVDIAAIISSYLQSARLLAQNKGITVHYSPDRPYYVWADGFLSEEVFMNYYTNAVNHCEGDKVIDITLEQREKVVRISVFNTGKPIPEDSIGRIWEKFYKVDKARTREYGGSGVGLSIVKAIMNLMGQKYGVRNYDNGVAFWFELESQAIDPDEDLHDGNKEGQEE